VHAVQRCDPQSPPHTSESSTRARVHHTPSTDSTVRLSHDPSDTPRSACITHKLPTPSASLQPSFVEGHVEMRTVSAAVTHDDPKWRFGYRTHGTDLPGADAHPGRYHGDQRILWSTSATSISLRSRRRHTEQKDLVCSGNNGSAVV